MSVLSPEETERLRGLRGLVATCILTGTVDPDYAQAREDMRAFNVEHGFKNVEYRNFYCVLVESGRDAVVAHAMAQGYDYVLQIDADAAPFPQDALVRLLYDAYVRVPHADAVGAYCQLKDAPYLPTIDTGTGTWEPHFPGEGLLRVIRTGGHFLLCKRSAYERFGPPWHRARRAIAPIDALREVDIFARTKLDGRNPFASTREWETLLAEARKSQTPEQMVGEDSGFCDRLTSRGGSIYVDCDLVAGHVGRLHITPDMLKQELERRAQRERTICGVFE